MVSEPSYPKPTPGDDFTSNVENLKIKLSVTLKMRLKVHTFERLSRSISKVIHTKKFVIYSVRWMLNLRKQTLH